MTAPVANEIILPHLYFTQFLGDRFAVVIGKLDTTGGDANEFAHGRGDDKFMNMAFSFNPVVATLAPYAPLGMSLLFLPHEDVIYSFAVVDTQGLPNTAGFNTLFQDPTTVTNEVRVTVRPFGLTGEALGSFFAPGWRIRGRARFSNSIVSVLAARELFRGVRTIDSASAITTSNSVMIFLQAFAGW